MYPCKKQNKKNHIIHTRVTKKQQQIYKQEPRPQPKPKPIQEVPASAPQQFQPPKHQQPIQAKSHWTCEQCSSRNRHIDFFCALCGFRKGYDPETDPNNDRLRASRQNLQVSSIHNDVSFI